MFFEADLSQVPKATRDAMHKMLTSEDDFARRNAEIEQRKIAKFYRDNRPMGIDAIGAQLKMSVHPYFRQAAKMKHGEDIVDDRDFWKWFRKQDGGVYRVEAKGTKIQSGWRPPDRHAKPSSLVLGGRSTAKRETVTYA